MQTRANRRGHRQGAGEGHQERQGVRAAQSLSAEREAAVRAALAAGMGIRRTARLVGTGNATVARIAAEMRGRLTISDLIH
jgi:DNA invertase Pin-like site-specific DNA recombinase